jgi:hypothetical protein
LSQAGFPVAAGFVVTTPAFERFLGQNELSFRPHPTEVETSILPNEAADAIALAAVPDTTDGAPVAVRSSGVAEDLAAASDAGQYETVLGVNTVPDMLEIAMAIRGQEADPCSSAEPECNQSSGESVDALAQVRVAQANGSACDGLVIRTTAAALMEHLDQPHAVLIAHPSALRLSTGCWLR